MDCGVASGWCWVMVAGRGVAVGLGRSVIGLETTSASTWEAEKLFQALVAGAGFEPAAFRL